MANGFSYEESRLFGDFGDVCYDLDIRRPIVQILGDSATGKTLLVDLLKNDREGKEAGNFSEFPNVYTLDKIGSSLSLDNITRSLIVIDRGDVLLDKTMINQIIRRRDNTYLIFARGALPLYISPNYYGEFVEKDGVIRIEYMFSVMGWY